MRSNPARPSSWHQGPSLGAWTPAKRFSFEGWGTSLQVTVQTRQDLGQEPACISSPSGLRRKGPEGVLPLCLWAPQPCSPPLFPCQSPAWRVAEELGDHRTEPSLDQALRERDEAIAK